MAFRLLPREDEYFALFSQITVKIQEAADSLSVMMDGPYEGLVENAKRIKAIEHECDDLTHQVTTKLNKSFITPFDREDIYTLAVSLDDVCDYIDAAARSIVMYDIRELNERAKGIAAILQELAGEINTAVGMLSHSKGMKSHLVEIQKLENDADELYFKAIADLFKATQDPVEIIKFKELYEILENATDRCEAVGNIIESIVLKHN
jgi:predicted phosphate transport protein (TIGR00153 family)